MAIETPVKVNQPELVIDQKVYQKIMHWVRKADGEVSGLGKVRRADDGTFTVVSAMLLPQKNTSASTEIDAAAIGKAMFELKDEEGELNFWWHSHVNMDVFWSTTDETTIKEFGNTGWVVATVFNKKAQMRSALYVKAPFTPPMPIFVDDLPTRIITFLQKTELEQWDKELEKNCKKPEAVLPAYRGYAPKTELSEPTKWELENGCRWLDSDKGWLKFPINNLGLVIGPGVKSYHDEFPAWVKKLQKEGGAHSISFLRRLGHEERLALLVEKKVPEEQLEYVEELEFEEAIKGSENKKELEKFFENYPHEGFYD